MKKNESLRKNVTSSVILLPLCNISLNYAIHQYNVHKCIFGKNDPKFLYYSSKWDFSGKVKIWRNKNVGRLYANYSTTEFSKSKQGPSESLSCQSWSSPPFSFSCKEIWAKTLQEMHRIDSKVSHTHRDAPAGRFGGFLWVSLLHDFVPPAPLNPFIAR